MPIAKNKSAMTRTALTNIAKAKTEHHQSEETHESYETKQVSQKSLSDQESYNPLYLLQTPDDDDEIYMRVLKWEWFSHLKPDEDDDDCKLRKLLEYMDDDKKKVLFYMDQERGYDVKCLRDKMDFINHMSNERKHQMFEDNCCVDIDSMISGLTAE